MSKTVIPYSGYGSQGLQVFTPVTVTTIGAAGTLDTSEVTCIRVSEPTDYQINGAGTVGTMPAGCTGIADGVTSIDFPNGAIVEVM
jgi:hypothetical protein